ncbi:unnamed protein product [Schistocephalus solidus]|uniref:Uncharacterized protein n=1 Tax=Schistocephalus solidus TaxID=70667 RepID=A0A183SVG5_SCHSO|nr:unnamed protein product [Schistocephalus solidus]
MFLSALNWNPTLTCGFSVLGSALRPSEEQRAGTEPGACCLIIGEVDIAAVADTRFSEQDQLEFVGAGYTFFWSGHPKPELASPLPSGTTSGNAALPAAGH